LARWLKSRPILALRQSHRQAERAETGDIQTRVRMASLVHWRVTAHQTVEMVRSCLTFY